SYCIFMPWISGVTLEDYYHQLEKKAITPYPSFPSLIIKFMGYLRQAQIFHNLGLIIGDPRPGNVIVNEDGFHMIDFDAVHPKNTRASVSMFWFQSIQLRTEIIK